MEGQGREEEEEEAAICLSQASGTLSPRHPPHIPPFQDLSVSSFLPSFLSAGHTFYLSRYFSFLLPTRKNSAGKDNFLTEGDKTAAELHSDFITFQTVKQPILKHINDPGTKTGLACILNTHLWSKCTFQLFWYSDCRFKHQKGLILRT